MDLSLRENELVIEWLKTIENDLEQASDSFASLDVTSKMIKKSK